MCMPWRHHQWEPIAKIFWESSRSSHFAFLSTIGWASSLQSLQTCQRGPLCLWFCALPLLGWQKHRRLWCKEGWRPHSPPAKAMENCRDSWWKLWFWWDKNGAWRFSLCFYANSWPSVSCTSYPHHRGCIVLRIVSLSLFLSLPLSWVAVAITLFLLEK